jgi:O-antigen/teichoic acid export membrane protein
VASHAAYAATVGDDVVTAPGTSATREVFRGSTRVFVAEALALPTGLITAAFLARQFHPDGYGLFTLTMAIVAWLEWTLASLFARAAVKVVADAPDWRPAGSVVLRTYAAGGVVGFGALWIAAGPLAALMHEPTLARHLRVLALDVPLFMLAQAHQQVLVGTGQYARRAGIAAVRWVSRMAFVLVLVAAGLSIDGALAAVVVASFVELAAARRVVRPSFRGASPAATRTMWTFALPLVAAALSLRLFDKLDLFVLKSLGASAAVAGVYGAAQNLTIIPNLVTLSLTTLLLSTLSRALRALDHDGAKALARNALRGALLMFPFAGVAAGASTGIATFIYGDAFSATGPLLAVLLFAALAVVMISVASAILTAGGRPGWAMLAAVPVAPLALVGHLAVIPRFGAMGAAAVTLIVAVIGALIAVATVRRAWRLWPPIASAARAGAVTVAVAVLGDAWITSGPTVVVEVAVMSLVAAGLLVLLGELTAAERHYVTALLRRTARPISPGV